MLSDRARQSKWRGALLYWVSVKNATSAVLAAVANRWKKPLAPGSVAVESDTVQVNAVTNSTNSQDGTNDLRAILLHVLAGALLPEYMFGDGKQANLATATKQELPALAKFEDFQHIMIRQLWTPLFRRVIQEAVDAGKLAREVQVQKSDGEPVPDEEPIEAIKAFEVAYEPVTQTDINSLTQALNLQAMNGWVSDVSAQEQLGLDPHKEAKRIAAELEQKRDEMAQGKRPIPPGMEQAMGIDDDEQDADEDEQPEGAAA